MPMPTAYQCMGKRVSLQGDWEQEGTAGAFVFFFFFFLVGLG